MQFWTIDQHPTDLPDLHARGEEIAPGVVIERRTVLRFSLQLASAAFLAKLTGCGAHAPAPAEPSTASPVGAPAASPGLTVGQLVERLHPAARRLIAADAPDEEAYLAEVGDMLAQLERVPPWRDGGGRAWSMDTTAHVPPIVLYQIHMQPGAVISLHDHRDYNGVILCTEGSVRCRNFEFASADGAPADVVPPRGATFEIRETRDEVLRAGMRSSLARVRDNLHEVTAGDDGCRLMDLFTHFRPDARSYALEWDGQPFDVQRGLYRVAWK